eukprot:2359262-Amphidinium_carterae.1
MHAHLLRRAQEFPVAYLVVRAQGNPTSALKMSACSCHTLRHACLRTTYRCNRTNDRINAAMMCLQHYPLDLR